MCFYGKGEEPVTKTRVRIFNQLKRKPHNQYLQMKTL